MRSTLFYNLYFDSNPDRRKELETCLKNNLSAGFDEIVLFVEEKDRPYQLELGLSHLSTQVVSSRPPFNRYISYANENCPDSLIVVCNSDIYFEKEELNKLKELPWHSKLFVGLSRWDQTVEGNFLVDRLDCQDSFIWKGECSVKDLNCPIGMAGSDNHILYKFHEAGYQVVNPGKSIMSNHLHNIKINNYRNKEGIVKSDHICSEPYHFAVPQLLHEIQWHR